MTHTKIMQGVISKMGYAIQEEEFVPKKPSRTREKRITSPSNPYSEICDEQIKMNAKINMLIEKIAKKNLISPTTSSEDDDEMI